jgi:hypothetical protein
MTALQQDFSRASSMKRVGLRTTDKVWLIHAAGKTMRSKPNKYLTRHGLVFGFGEGNDAA